MIQCSDFQVIEGTNHPNVIQFLHMFVSLCNGERHHVTNEAPEIESRLKYYTHQCVFNISVETMKTYLETGI